MTDLVKSLRELDERISREGLERDGWGGVWADEVQELLRRAAKRIEELERPLARRQAEDTRVAANGYPAGTRAVNSSALETLSFCTSCGVELEEVRPGSHQHPATGSHCPYEPR